MKEVPNVSPVFTVFTPTYNRAATLPDVYEALLAQTFKSFEWLIIDDGSTDESGGLVNSWIAQDRIPIRYYFKKSGGKHTAYNIAIGLAQGCLFLNLDSDDTCTSTALKRFYEHWCKIDENVRHLYSGVSCLCHDASGFVIGGRFPRDPWDGYAIDLVGLKGEKWGFHRTEILQQYPFPEFPGEKFVPEWLIWNRIGSRYKLRCVNEALRIYRHTPYSIIDNVTVQSRLILWTSNKEFRSILAPGTYRLQGRFMIECSLW